MEKRRIKKSFPEVRPELLLEWDYSKNSGINPFEIGSSSKLKFKWTCPNGHSYDARVDHRVREGSGCPYCSGRKVTQERSLTITHPWLAAEWHPTNNGILSPEQISAGSPRIVWWYCPSCQQEWQAAINNRRRGKSCSHKTKRTLAQHCLALENPNLSEEWDYIKNKSTPFEVLSHSAEKVFWKCGKCENSWRSSINHRMNGSGCPKCQQRTPRKPVSAEHCLATIDPKLSLEWDIEGNGNLKPYMVTPNSGQRVRWKCSKCLHKWEATVDNRRRNRGCPECHKFLSYREACVRYYLSQSFPATLPHHTFPELKIGSHVDIYLPEVKIAIEYDGYYYHLKRKKADESKDKKLEKLGIKVIRIRESLNGKLLPPLTSNAYCLNVAYEQSPAYLIESLEEVLQTIGVYCTHKVNIEEKHFAILELIKREYHEKSIAFRFPEVALQWHPEKNGEIRPEHVRPSTKNTYWFKCKSCHHEWEQLPITRIRSPFECPKCRIKKSI